MTPLGHLAITLLSLTGCTSDAPPPPITADVLPLEDYTALEESATWTWRDDGMDTGLVLEEVVRGLHTGDGYVALRRGVRWGDADEVGFLQWEVGNGLALSAWQLGELVGTSSVKMVANSTNWGDTHTEDDWSCTTRKATEVDTWYGVFDDGLEVTCSGDAGLAGTFSFAAGRGLVRLQDAEFELNLVSAAF